MGVFHLTWMPRKVENGSWFEKRWKTHLILLVSKYPLPRVRRAYTKGSC